MKWFFNQHLEIVCLFFLFLWCLEALGFFASETKFAFCIDSIRFTASPDKKQSIL